MERCVERPLLDRKGYVETLAVRCQFGVGGEDFHVGETVLEIIAPKQFLVVVEPVGIVAVRGREEFPPDMLGGGDDRSQIAVAERVVADEVDGPDGGLDAFVDFIDKIDPVLRQANDLGFDAGRIVAGTAIDRQDSLKVALDFRAGEDRALLELGFLLQVLVLDLAVALEIDPIDHRVFLDDDDQIIAAPEDADIGEQPGLK